MLMLILDKVNLPRCRLNIKGIWQDLAFLIWGPTMIRLRTIHDVCISIKVTLCNKNSDALILPSVCYLRDSRTFCYIPLSVLCSHYNAPRHILVLDWNIL